MKRLVALVLLAACGAPVPVGSVDAGVDAGVPDAGTGLTAQQLEWLSAHNQIRQDAIPAPSPLLPSLTWSASAQALAEDWVNRCNFMHRDPNALGENLFASTADESATAITGDWASEASNYTYSSNTCAVGKDCGHYTQIVWRDTQHLGCAVKRCTTGSPFPGPGAWYFAVCNYDPPGNYIGQKPY